MPLRYPEEELQSRAGAIMPLQDFGHMVGLQLRAHANELGILLPVANAQKARDFGHQVGVRARFRGGAERGATTLEVNERWGSGFEGV